MPFVSAPNIAMVEMRATNAGQRIENRIMVNNLAPIDMGSLQEIATQAWDWWVESYKPLLPDAVSLREVVATDLTTQDGEQFTYAPNSITTGSLIGLNMPNEVTLCVSMRSGSRGRSARGRFYWLALGRFFMADANNVTQAFADSCRGAVQELLTGTFPGRAVVVVSYRTNNAPRPGGPVYYILNSATVTDTIVDSMRRRKPGVGS